MKKVNYLSAYLELSCATTPTVKTLKTYIKMLSKMGYDEFYMGLTDAYKIPGYPYFNYKRGTYSQSDLQEIDEYGRSLGITVIPSIQVLGHLDYIFRHDSFKPLMDTPHVMEVGNEKTYQLVEAMLKSISDSFKGRRIHVGMDETFGIGTGNYLRHNPPKDKKALLLEYLTKVVEIAKKYNLQLEIWGDGLIDKENTSVTAEDVKKALPEDTIAWQWDYQNDNKKDIKNMINNMQKHAYSMGFSGCAWRFHSLGPSNRYSIRRIKNQLDVCETEGVDRFMITIWGDRGMPCSIYSVLPTLFMAAEYNNGCPIDNKNINKQKFKDICGVSFDDAYSLDYLNDPFKRKKTDYLNAEAFWIFYTDLFVGNHDMLLSDGVEKAYRSLANRLKRVECSNDLKHVFDFSSGLAKVLSIKGKLGVLIREAYVKKDKICLENLIKTRLNPLIKEQKKFNKMFNQYYLTEYQALGLEFNQNFVTHVLMRYEFVKERLLDYIKNDTQLDEIGDGSLLPDYIPQASEDYCLACDYTLFLSYSFSYIG